VSAPTREIDQAIKWAYEDLKVARIIHNQRRSPITANNVVAFENALNGLLDRRREYR
jgi:hypothetical protein